MSRTRRVSSKVWAFLDKVGWIIALVFIGAGFVTVHNQGHQLHEQSRALSRQVAEGEAARHAQTRAQVEARRINCDSSNRLRAGLRQNVINGERNLPLVLKLLPQLNTPEVLAINRVSIRFQLHVFAAVNCKVYAEEVLPGHQHTRPLDGAAMHRAGF